VQNVLYRHGTISKYKWIEKPEELLENNSSKNRIISKE
jgi:hypothetical protein